MEEMTISIKDLFYRLFLRWRLILVWMFIGAAAFGGLGYVKNVKKAQTSVQESDAEALIEEYKAQLSEREISEVEKAVDIYNGYQKSYDMMEEYTQKSVRMQLNPNAVPTVRLQYLIDTHYEAVYPIIEAKDMTEDIVNSYMAKIKDTEIYEEIAGTLGEQVESAYVQELIAVDYTADLLTITVNALKKEECEKISEVIQSTIEAETSSLRGIYGEFDITLIHELYYDAVDTKLLNEQQQQVSSFNSLKNTLNSNANNMSDNQKKYYYALVDQQLESEKIQVEKAEETSVEAVKLFHVKYILLGVIVGAFLACCYVGLRYLTSATMRVKEDLQECFGITNLGVLPAAKTKKTIFGFVDSWIDALFGKGKIDFSDEERIRMICAGIRIAAQKFDMKSVYLTGVCNDVDAEQFKRLICEKLEKEVPVVRYGKSVIYDPESLEAMASADGVVLVERIGQSRYEELKKEAELCVEQQVKVIGSVVLE